MKKIFTLFAGLLMAAAVFAADRRPTVTVNSSRNYKIVIDGRSYFGSNYMAINLDQFAGKRLHTIKVYEIRRGFFVRERLVDAATFMVGRNDIMIKIGLMGQIKIREMKDFGRNGRYDRNGKGWNDNDWNSGRDYDGRDSRGIPDDSHDNRDNRDGRGGRGF